MGGLHRFSLGGTTLAAFALLVGAAHSPVQSGADLPAQSRTLHDTAATKQVGALFQGGSHFCSASVVHSPGRDLLITAAHCLAGGVAGLTFVPGYHDGRAPYGTWQVVGTVTDGSWDDDQDDDHDVAFATVSPLNGHRIEDEVGAETLDTDSVRSGVTTVIGYPATEDAPLTCSNAITSFSPTQLRIACAGYASGTSGGPWLTSSGKLIGVIGGYQQGGDTDDISYSVSFGASVRALYDEAAAR